MQLHKLSQTVYYSDCDPKTDRPVLGYLHGEKLSVMIDAGNSARHSADFLAAVQAQGLPLPDYCVLTHWHWDHTFGMCSLPCPTIAHTECQKKLLSMSQWKWTDTAMKQRLQSGEEIPFADEHIRAEYPDLSEIKVVEATKTFSEHLSLDCGSFSCDCIHLPSAHSDDSIAVHLPKQRIIFIGDCYNDDFYQNHFRDLQKTTTLYRLLQELPFDTAIPGHSRPLSKEQLLHFLKQFV